MLERLRCQMVLRFIEPRLSRLDVALIELLLDHAGIDLTRGCALLFVHQLRRRAEPRRGFIDRIVDARDGRLHLERIVGVQDGVLRPVRDARLEHFALVDVRLLARVLLERAVDTGPVRERELRVSLFLFGRRQRVRDAARERVVFVAHLLRQCHRVLALDVHRAALRVPQQIVRRLDRPALGICDGHLVGPLCRLLLRPLDVIERRRARGCHRVAEPGHGFVFARDRLLELRAARDFVLGCVQPDARERRRRDFLTTIERNCRHSREPYLVKP